MAVVAGIAKIGHRKTHHSKHITLKTGTLGNLDPAYIKDTHRLRITPISLEIAKGLILPTIGYDGGSPGPVLRMRAGIPTAKDTVCIEPNGHVEVDFIADKPGLSLFHCHMENHMKDGFMSLFETT